AIEGIIGALYGKAVASCWKRVRWCRDGRNHRINRLLSPVGDLQRGCLQFVALDTPREASGVRDAVNLQLDVAVIVVDRPCGEQHPDLLLCRKVGLLLPLLCNETRQCWDRGGCRTRFGGQRQNRSAISQGRAV